MWKTFAKFGPEGATARKLMQWVMERNHLHCFLLFIHTRLPHYFLLYFQQWPSLCSQILLFLSSFTPSVSICLSLFHFLLSLLNSLLSFFSWLHSFLYKLLSVSPSLSLTPPSSSPWQSANSPTAQPVRFRPPPRKQGLKFKAAVVDWRKEREHRRRPDLGQNRLEYRLK